MFKYVKYIPITDEHTTHTFNELNDKCKVHRFDVPYVSIECELDVDFNELMSQQNPDIDAVEITRAQFEELVQYSDQVKRMYDVANEQYKKECSVITGKYTQEEVSTWSTQVAEAEAVKAGLAVNTPFLSALAEDEEVTLSVAADKILLLRDASAAYTANALKNKWDTLKKLKAEVGL